jgi:hypothetical protein
MVLAECPSVTSGATLNGRVFGVKNGLMKKQI